MNQQVSTFEKGAGGRARHRALIMQILAKYPGLTHQQILAKELDYYGFTFLTDNRLRELRGLGWVESQKDSQGLLRWYIKKVNET